MAENINSSDQKARNNLDRFFVLKNRFFYIKKKPVSNNYPFEVIDPFTVFDNPGVYKNFYLVGDNWKDHGIRKPIALLWGFNDWKLGFTSAYLPEYRCAFAPRKYMVGSAFKLLLSLKGQFKPSVFLVWAYTESFAVRLLSKIYHIPIIRVEDGFIRSAELGASHSTPYSLVFDKSGLHYNPRSNSCLETVLNKYDFKSNKALIKSAREFIDIIIKLSLTKYNSANLVSEAADQRIKIRGRVAILGQVDSDASIRFGNIDKWSHEELIKLAKYENPEADIIYRPHPDIFNSYQKSKFKSKRVKNLCRIVNPEEPLAEFLGSIDHVYTITSLGGFDALIRGIKVTCVGVPFYAGWGLTDDRAIVKKRNRKISLEELFAGAHLIYPRYLADVNNQKTGLTAALFRIAAEREIALNSVCADALTKDFNQAPLVAKTNCWPQVFINHKDKLDTKIIAKIFSTIDFASIFKSSSANNIFQTFVLFLISGALPDNKSRDMFITQVRSYVEPTVLNELLLYLDRIFHDNYITLQMSWLLVENNERSASILYNDKKVFEILKRRLEKTKLTPEDIDSVSVTTELVSIYDTEVAEIWFNNLDMHISNRNFKEAFTIIKRLLLLNYSLKNLLQRILTLAHLSFDYGSAKKIAQFSQGLNIFQNESRAVIAEVKATQYMDRVINKEDHMCLLSKLLTLKPENISVVQFNALLYPDVFQNNLTSDIFEGMLSLDNEISPRKAAAYIAVHQPGKAVKIIEKMIDEANISDKSMVLYSQALSFNKEIDKAFEVMRKARSVRVTSANIRESLRLCVLVSNYQLSNKLLKLAQQHAISVGEMHKRKLYFGNRMIKEAFKTFTELDLINNVSKYFSDKFYRFENPIDSDASILLLAIFGPGDEIRFASIYNLFTNEFPTQNISVACLPRFLALFSRSFPSLNFVPVERPRNSDTINLDDYSLVPGSDIIGVVNNRAVKALERSDKLLFVTDLLHRCLPSYEAFPGTAYLYADPEKVDAFTKRLPIDTVLIGLSWRSSLKTHSRDEHYLTVEQLEPLFSVPGFIFVNFQYDECAEDLAWIQQRYPGKVIDFEDVDHYNDFDSVAALMKCMHLMISPATTVVELAGALGCPTWLFSNSSEIDWRKIDMAGTDVWHNNTKIVEGKVLGDKKSLVAELHERLIQYIDEKTKRSAP